MNYLLPEICNIQYGFAFDSKQFSDENKNGSIPLIRIRDVKRGFSETYYDGDYDQSYLVHKNDLLIGMDGEFNIARWKSGDALLNQRVCKIQANSDVDEEYLRFMLIGKLKEIERKTAFVTVKHLSAKELNRLKVEMPSYLEQNRRAEVLAGLERLKSKYEKSLNDLDCLVKSRFVEMFETTSLPSISLEECCTDILGGSTPSMKHPEYYGGSVPFIKSGDVKDWSLTHGSLWLTEKALEETTAKYVPAGSILVVNRSAALLREFHAAIAENPVVINQDIKAFIPKTEVLSEYLLWAIIMQTQLLLTKVTTVLTSHIDLKDLKALQIKMPSLETQLEFVAFVEQIDKSKSVVQKSLDEAQLLYNSLMQEFFG